MKQAVLALEALLTSRRRGLKAIGASIPQVGNRSHFGPSESGQVREAANEIITGENWRDKVLNRTGIICFEDYYTRSEGSGGDHIDLWNGSHMTGVLSGLRARFGIVIPFGVWSDLRKAKRIRFFPVK